MSPAAWRAVALLGVCATLIAGSLAPESTVAQQLSYFLILFVLILGVSFTLISWNPVNDRVIDSRNDR